VSGIGEPDADTEPTPDFYIRNSGKSPVRTAFSSVIALCQIVLRGDASDSEVVRKTIIGILGVESGARNASRLQPLVLPVLVGMLADNRGCPRQVTCRSHRLGSPVRRQPFNPARLRGRTMNGRIRKRSGRQDTEYSVVIPPLPPYVYLAIVIVVGMLLATLAAKCS
jgi:hypothetical protein